MTAISKKPGKSNGPDETALAAIANTYISTLKESWGATSTKVKDFSEHQEARVRKYIDEMDSIFQFATNSSKAAALISAIEKFYDTCISKVESHNQIAKLRIYNVANPKTVISQLKQIAIVRDRLSVTKHSALSKVWWLF